ncbi:MAG: oligopeptide/dipeptide ABC transporter ATP-binding protein [Zestosphaera sp.]
MLLSSIPVLDPMISRSRKRVKPLGEPPSPINPPPGCRFHPRCPHSMNICKVEEPPLIETESGHQVSCRLHTTNESLPT